MYIYNMDKEYIATIVKEARTNAGVSITELRNKGIHPIMPSKIETGFNGYTIDSLLEYLKAIDENLTIKIITK